MWQRTAARGTNQDPSPCVTSTVAVSSGTNCVTDGVMSQ